MSVLDLSGFTTTEEIVDPVEAAREEWFEKRRGKFTCSKFGDLAKSGRGKDELWSQNAWTYIHQIVAERIGSYVHPFEARQVAWGTEHEAEALDCYEALKSLPPGSMVTGNECFTQLNEYCAGTPDALIDEDGCAEVKCPYTPQEHVAVLASKEVPDKYKWQVAGHLLITGRKYCDFISYDPRIDGEHKIAIVRVEPDEGELKWLKNRIDAAEQEVQETLKAIGE